MPFYGLIVAAFFSTLATILAIRYRGRWRFGFGVLTLAFIAGAVSFWSNTSPPPAEKLTSPVAVAGATTSDACAACHREQYDSWHRSFHRTMTREATPVSVKGDFHNATHDYGGVRSRFTREGDQFFLETATPEWALRQSKQPATGLPVQTKRYRVDRLVGSHWLQECLHREASGRYTRLPVLYHLGEKQWVHTHGAFLTPDSDDFWSLCRGANWNESCLYCHNTGPAKNPVRDQQGKVFSYDTTVNELGISCEACHGPGGEHVRRHTAGVGNSDVVHPGALSVARRDDICARCHGALVPEPAMWDRVTHRDPFRAGDVLTKFNHLFWSESQQASLVAGLRTQKPAPPEPTDGRFWGDGTPLTTALEFNGMALSACYQQGHGKMSCLSCHTLHGSDPNHQLKPQMRTNEACYQCHESYRTTLAAHTRHAGDSAGSLCANCHMPHVVYSLMDTHRSHRIQIPDLAASLGTGKPHACNLCHLDKSLGWTRDELAKWPNGKKHSRGELSADEETVAHSILTLAQSDARTRAIVAGAFEKPAARKASGDDWPAPVLTRLLHHERYPAVRYLARRGLKAVHGELSFDHMAKPADRAAQLRLLQQRFDALPIRPRPGLPLTPTGRIDDVLLARLLKKRNDPDVAVNE